ncbi:MAG: folylpolyglutamate synthase/dihydrofolate synthase family protein [Bacillota bacterium]|nr:folylpolyglutamate synthase/dihydrofolate synthase family protein [Bacillota bacterium]
MNKFETLDDYIDWIYDLGPRNESRTLRNIQALMNRLDNPQDKIKVIHVAGTNGKGSTCNFIYGVLSRKFKCGIFLSPYMGLMTESMKINGQAISPQAFMAYIDYLRPIVEDLKAKGHHITYFEAQTALMYKYFYDQGVDVAVVEVGLGGLNDATNVVSSPLASLIVTIALDHVGILGSSLEEIAEKKAGIIKAGRPVFVYPQEPKLMEIFEKVAREKNSPLYSFSKDEVKVEEMNEDYNQFAFRTYPSVKTRLIGVHQLYNASLAISFLDSFKEYFGLTKDDIVQGIYSSSNPGRLELISKNPRVLVDGSHNAEAIAAMKESLKVFSYKKLIVGFSTLKDKDYAYTIREMSQIADLMIITSVDNPVRAFTMEELKTEVLKYRDQLYVEADKKKAYQLSKTLAEEGDLVLWCGSLYLVRDIRELEINKEN